MNTTVSNTELSPGEIALEAAREKSLQDAHEKRVAGLAKARAARAEKARLRAEGALVDEARDAFWREVYLTLARAREARGLKDWTALIELTDEILDALEDAGKI